MGVRGFRVGVMAKLIEILVVSAFFLDLFIVFIPLRIILLRGSEFWLPIVIEICIIHHKVIILFMETCEAVVLLHEIEEFLAWPIDPDLIGQNSFIL